MGAEIKDSKVEVMRTKAQEFILNLVFFLFQLKSLFLCDVMFSLSMLKFFTSLILYNFFTGNYTYC